MIGWKKINKIEGNVFLYEKNKEKYAVKIIEHDTKQEIQDYIKDFDEIKELKHHNLVEILELKVENLKSYLVMKYYPQGDISYLIKKKKFKKQEIEEMILQLAEGIEYLHTKGFIHRDINPKNILFTGKNSFKILINIQKMKKKDNDRYSLIGKLPFIAPEVLNNEKYNESIDVYSLGYLFKEISKDSFQNLILKMLEKKSENRITLNSLIKRLNEKQNFKDLPDEIVEIILSYSFNSKSQFDLYSFVNKQWRNVIKLMLNDLKFRYIIIGFYILDIDKCKFIGVNSDLIQFWSDKNNFKKLNRENIIQDEYYVYYLNLVKNNYELICSEINTNIKKWSIQLQNGLKFPIQFSQDKNFIYILFLDNKRAYAFRKYNGESFELLKDKNVQSISSLKHHIVFDEKTLSYYRIYITKKPSKFNDKFEYLHQIDLNPNICYGIGSFYGRENIPVYEYDHDLILCDLRSLTSMYLTFSVLDINGKELYSYKIIGNHPITVDLTFLGVNHWVFHGREYTQNLTKAIDFKNFKIHETPISDAFHLIESESGEFIGFCSASKGNLTFYKEGKEEWNIEMKELDLFTYYPQFEFRVFKNEIGCLMYGSKGIFYYLIDLKGKVLWKKNICGDDFDYSQFGLFDIQTGYFKRKNVLVFITTLKSHSYNVNIINFQSGNILFFKSHSWNDNIEKKEDTKSDCILS